MAVCQFLVHGGCCIVFYHPRTTQQLLPILIYRTSYYSSGDSSPDESKTSFVCGFLMIVDSTPSIDSIDDSISLGLVRCSMSRRTSLTDMATSSDVVVTETL